MTLPALTSRNQFPEDHTPSATQLRGEHAPDPRSHPRVLSCKGTADFLAAIPFLAGYTAPNSLFVVLFRGKSSCNALRLDMPSSDSAAATRTLIDSVIELLQHTDAGAKRPAFVITTDRVFDERGRAPWRDFARQLLHAMRDRGWSAREAAMLAANGWTSFLGADAGSLRALSEVSASGIASQATELVPAPRELKDIGVLPPADPSRAAEISARLQEISERSSQGSATAEQQYFGTPTWLLATVRVAAACFAIGHDGDSQSFEPIEPRLLARLIVAAQHPDRWQVLALSAVTRPGFVELAVSDSEPGHFVDVSIDIDADDAPSKSRGWSVRRVLQALSLEPPSPSKIRQAITMLEDAAAHSPDALKPGILALLAWLWWLLGLQSVAQRMVQESFSFEPQHEITLMVERVITQLPLSRLDALKTPPK